MKFLGGVHMICSVTGWNILVDTRILDEGKILKVAISILKKLGESEFIH